MRTEGTSGLRLGIIMAAFVVVGGPLVLYVWHALSDLLIGRIHTGELALALGLLAALVALAAALGRLLLRTVGLKE